MEHQISNVQKDMLIMPNGEIEWILKIEPHYDKQLSELILNHGNHGS